MTKTLGLDLGTKTLGLCVSDLLKITVNPIENFTFEEDNYPWVFQPDSMDSNVFNLNEVDIEIEKGKVVIFNSKMNHSLNNFGSVDDVRHSIAFNIWPYGNINNRGGSMLSYPPEPLRDI